MMYLKDNGAKSETARVLACYGSYIDPVGLMGRVS